MKRNRTLRLLQLTHLTILIIGILVITILHIFTQNFWDFLRIPVFLRSIDEFLGQGWPISLSVYHAVLVTSLLVALINAAGLIFYKNKVWRIATDIVTFVGFLIIWPICLFFALILATAQNLSEQNVHTILVYFLFTLSIFILDLVTWYFDDQSLVTIVKRKRSR